MTLESVVKTVMEEIRTIAKTETVVGKEIKAGESTIVPVSKISFGFGGGGGTGKEGKEGTGVAGGATVEPIAFIVVTNGRAQLMPLTDKSGNLGKVIDLIPEVLGKFTGKKAKENNQAADPKASE
ncbi:MAG: hypothetical protein A2268_00040 [Candidatus Raymondbacteria bacterium RifOxyA12_full_50_37]|uniref:Sporulation protein YtfJ n=1 Tax=Candidatus Raymondbacteria bacterium RIFOXYD12_FULL_49_13 TaxID=1817890 RepID=A0A1F7F3B3_UNCRA|nr:MAG: hypothetical protein A2248_00360 [Candidatus Raymondbacteria bacterium RIFOXYA2_FULL_49_16]OGJ91096.1 MAG: hypothetical protein A2350_07310 [Candidatus Raymondbacteria bacterium RifOxyB12_full_50_8]OGJ91365.1 MAG: hypothetical protein A2268_00040 [Candidatus Raymondbacteria bacterium RifOxyA12_full_50_37]OGJ97150.1 MAG: hypothetical protein A2453_12560 [Candidatus Raymondbacteria bacterium RIFOXYC2_FULL_50_21]OGK01149.1 MAG: hypothetical protein A2519_01330 [Candidatus Raymondbacteria b